MIGAYGGETHIMRNGKDGVLEIGEGFECQECHKAEYPMFWTHGEELKGKGLCIDCDHWTKLLPMEGESIRVKGRHWIREPDAPPGFRGFVGCSGRRFEIEFFDNRPNVVSRNMWTQGTIPDHFRDRLPDNARFV